jgi:hypothetical protein
MAHSPSFLLVHGTDIQLLQDVLSGTPKVAEITNKHWDQEPRQWASSRRRPIYTAWTRCGRSPRWKETGKETLYLIREDGIIRHFSREHPHAPGLIGNTGNFDCNVTTAVASLNHSLADPDILIAAGDMSNGQLATVGVYIDY